MEQPMFSLASYHGERKLAWKRICNTLHYSASRGKKSAMRKHAAPPWA